MEYLQVFDKNKNMLKEKVARSDKWTLEEGKYFMVVVIFIENSEGKFLIQKTSKRKQSVYATTGGHVTYGDDGRITTVKEVQEELGLTINKEDLVYIGDDHEDCCYMEIYYTKKDVDINTLTLQEEEVEFVNWYTIDEINKLIEEDKFRKGNIDAFNRVLKYIKK